MPYLIHFETFSVSACVHLCQTSSELVVRVHNLHAYGLSSADLPVKSLRYQTCCILLLVKGTLVSSRRRCVQPGIRLNQDCRAPMRRYAHTLLLLAAVFLATQCQADSSGETRQAHRAPALTYGRERMFSL
jgi:hypothetical protein